MKNSKKKRRHYTLPTPAVVSRVIRRVMNSSSNKDISEDEIFKKLSYHTGISVNYFKTRRNDILEISDTIATELGLERDCVFYHFDVIESIIHRSIFDWPDVLDNIQERKELATYITNKVVKFFDETGDRGAPDDPRSASDIISLDDIYEELISDERLDSIDSEMLAYGLIEVWDYLLDQSLIT
jgi:hypothetical protein